MTLKWKYYDIIISGCYDNDIKESEAKDNAIITHNYTSEELNSFLPIWILWIYKKCTLHGVRFFALFTIRLQF